MFDAFNDAQLPEELNDSLSATSIILACVPPPGSPLSNNHESVNVSGKNYIVDMDKVNEHIDHLLALLSDHAVLRQIWQIQQKELQAIGMALNRSRDPAILAKGRKLFALTQPT